MANGEPLVPSDAGNGSVDEGHVTKHVPTTVKSTRRGLKKSVNKVNVNKYNAEKE